MAAITYAFVMAAIICALEMAATKLVVVFLTKQFRDPDECGISSWSLLSAKVPVNLQDKV